MENSQLTQCIAEIRAGWSADEVRRRRQSALRAQSMLHALVSDAVPEGSVQVALCASDVTEAFESRHSPAIAAVVA